MLRRLQSLSRSSRRTSSGPRARGSSRARARVFDLLTKPDPVLTDEQRAQVKKIARKLMEHITDRLVLDWRKKAETREAARVLVKDVLDELPDAYDPETWQRKTDAVFNHIFASYYDDGHSVYDEPERRRRPRSRSPRADGDASSRLDVDEITQAVLEQIEPTRRSRSRSPSS